MEGGNEVDLSNNNITPLWKRRTDSNAGKAKPRPHSYQIDGVLMTDFPVEDNSNFKVSQAVENTVSSQVETMVLKHVFNKPARKTRVVRSISIGHQYSNRFPLSKTRSDSEQHGVDNPVYSTVDRPKVNNGSPQWINRHCSGNQEGPQKRLSSPVSLISQTDQIVFGLSPSTPDHIWMKRDLPATVSNSSNLYSPDQEQARVPLPASDPPTPSSSSASPMSCTPSDPPTPSASSPEERGVGLWQSPESKALPAIVLSTHSLAAMKVGTQQLIPKGLASVVRTTKGAAGNPGTTGHLEPMKRAPRVRSMVETSSFFSISGDEPEGRLDESGALKRGIRSTSYRRAVVSGIDLDVPAGPLKSHQLSQPILKGLQEDREPTISLGKSKTAERKKGLSTQRTFDSEGDEVLYQNYQEKALHNDSDSDGDSKLPQPDRGIVVQYRPLQSSWSQLSVVKKSRVCERMTPEERKRQEAIFEVISSEHSYLHSLEILIRMFKSSTELSDTMTKTDHHHLFSNIVDVCEASKKFFKELEDRHQNNIVIDDISDIVEKHALSTFDPYVTYCSNEVYQQRTLQRLLTKNPAFKEALSRIEAHPDCRNLPMISFLILPMQRVTRLPLLMDTICQKTPKDSPRYRACKTALQSVSKLVRQCNEGARRMERTEMMYTINSQLGFKIKPFPLVSSSRWLVKRGELTAFVEDNGIFMRRTSRQLVYLFLFNDVFIITRKKSEESYTVMDYALKDHIQVESCQAEGLNLSPVRAPATMLTSRHPAASHLFRVEFCSNHSQEKVSMVLGAEHLNERARWISALGQSSSDKKNADRTKLRQVEVTRTYTAKQPDELSLQVADVVLVWQSVEDGWYEGQRLRDGECGWFPDECAEEITCQATVERNMQRMERLQGLETNV